MRRSARRACMSIYVRFASARLDVYANIQVHVSSISLYFNENLEYTIYSILLLVFKTGIRIKIGPFLTQARTRQKNA